MSSALEHAKKRYSDAREACRRQAGLRLGHVLGVEFHVSGWSNKGREAMADQWVDLKGATLSAWDWNEIFRRHHDPDRLDMVIWGPDDRLCGVGLALTTGQAVDIRFVEGDPRIDCPLKGKRTLIFLECAAGYAQQRGKAELRIEPKNSALVNLYTDVYGFSLETPRGANAYYRKAV